MSYLVDALKRAERERRTRQSGDLETAAGVERARRSGNGASWRWLVAILVAVNVGLALYIWRPQADDASAPNTAASAVEQAASRSHASLEAFARDNGTQTGRDASTASTTAPVSSVSVASQTRDDNRPASPVTGRAADDRDTGGDGSVRYSSVPLSAEPDTSSITDTAEDDAQDEPPSRTPSDAPRVAINGQLYSSVPGRSFILVNGRRYHEGERLASGPAVEQIEPDGAILRYHGQRYHVSGPG